MLAARRILVSAVVAVLILSAGLGVESTRRSAGDPGDSSGDRRTTGALASLVLSSGVAMSQAGALANDGTSSGLERRVAPMPRRPRPKVRPQRTVTMAFTGDMIPHGPVTRQALANGGGTAYDFGPMLSPIESTIANVDLALCHLETPLSRDNTSLSGYPVFNAPRELAEAVAAAGYDGCSVASNHSYDRREAGVIATADLLEANGLGFAGIARSPDEAAAAQMYDADGVAVAHLSFTYGLNGFVLPSGKGYLVDLIEGAVIEQRASVARAAGADIVVVSLHWGSEYVSTPTADQVELAEQLLGNDDIDLLVGHHAHVVQPIGEFAGKPVVYGLGNLLSNQSSACCTTATQDGVIVKMTFVERREGGFGLQSGCIVATWVDRSDYVISPHRGRDRRAPKESVQRTVATIGEQGAFDRGFRPSCRRR